MTVSRPKHAKRKKPAQKTGKYVLQLYITGQSPRSIRAIETIKRICESNLKGQYSLEVIDIYAKPQAAVDAQIIAAPTVVKRLPEPLRKLIGDLSNEDKVLAGLDIRPRLAVNAP